MKHAHAYSSTTRRSISSPKSPYAEITDQIVKAIEDGQASYEMPWHQTGNPIPSNVESGKQYRGINILSLWVSSLKQGFSSGAWGTYKQWSDLGCQVRRGEKSSSVVFWDSYVDDQAEGEDEKRISFCKRYSVFNSSQVDGFHLESTELVNENEVIASAESFFLNLNSDIRVGGNVAGYSKSGDYIRMPELKQFNRSEGYYSTLAHEHVHWSGHVTRLNRDLTGRFGDASYAFEELIAELGAAFLSSHIGVKTSPRTDHAGYIATWLRVLKSDPRAIFTAASSAQKAIDYLKQQSEEDPVLVGKALTMAARKVFSLSASP